MWHTSDITNGLTSNLACRYSSRVSACSSLWVVSVVVGIVIVVIVVVAVGIAAVAISSSSLQLAII